MRRVGLLLTGLLMLCLAASSAPASAATAPLVTIDSARPALEKNDDGGWKVGLGLTNLTGDDVQVKVASSTPAAGGGCTVTFLGDNATKAIATARHDSVELDFGAGCTVPDSGVSFALTAAGPDKATQTLDGLFAAPKPKAETPAAVEWNQLRAFPLAWGLGILLLLAAAWSSSVVKGEEKSLMLVKLKSLPATWSFDESWVTNITLLGGVLTSVVGTSSVVKAILGEDSDAAIALATVGAAIAAVVIGLGVVFLQLSRMTGGGVFRVWGLVLAGGATLAGAYGELWVVWRMADKLGLGAAQNWVAGAAIGTAVLLAVYAFFNLRSTIELGATPPPDPPIVVPDDAAVAAVLLKHALPQDPATSADVIEEIRTLLTTMADDAKDKDKVKAAADAAAGLAPAVQPAPMKVRSVSAMI